MNHRHITDDPERTAGYVLGRISPEERERMDLHLRECAACRAAIEAELRTAAAARRLGRDRMKARLRHHLLRPRLGTRILAVAAGVATLVGIGVIARQLMVQTEQPQVLETPQTVQTAPITGQDRLRDADRESHRIAAEKKSELRNEVQAPASRIDESVTVASSPAPAPAMALEKAKEAPVAAEQELGAAGKMVAEDSYWTEGIPSSAPNRSEERAFSASMDKKDMAAKGAGVAARAQQQFVLTQRRAADLPVARQNRQIYRNSIPTHVQQRGLQTVMTLYLDSLVDQNDLDRARVDQPGADSLVIRMRDQNIQYQLPVNRSRQQVR